MTHYTLCDLSSQQKSLIEQGYDLRVTNLARFIYKKIGKKPGNLIDIGAGNGLILRFFRDKGFRVTGMELSKVQTKLMKKSPLMKGIKVIQGDISKVQGEEDYDYVLASDVIEHIEDDDKALKNLFTFVKPGGLLILSVPAHAHLFGKRDKLWGHYLRYEKDILKRKLNNLNGQLVFITFWNFVGYFAYFFYEKILGKPIKEDFRYSPSLSGKISRGFLDFLLKLEELLGFVPWGLTLVAAVMKNK